MRNDTAVFDALRFDPEIGERVSIGQMGTRQAILRDGLEFDPTLPNYCPHEWINADGYVDLELVRKNRYALAI